jgi:uncharacterized protein (TIGR02145 family)
MQITINSISSVTISWQDNSAGEEGFKIDRQTNTGVWQLAFATVNANQSTYTDNTVSMANSYTYRVYAFAGEYTSPQLEKQIPAALPALTTTAATNITATTAASGGTITSDGGLPVTARGVCWSTNQNPTITDSHTTDATGTGTFSSSITGLTGGTTYYVQAYATNSVFTAYGNQQNFTTSFPDGPGATITDIDGNVYNTVWINGRQWTKENLKTTKYRDGSAIPNITDNTAWTTQSAGAYCWYNNDIANKPTYGALYNFYTVNTGNLCPTGWHVPTDAEWYAMENYVDPTINDPNATGWRGTDAGTKLKATSGWYSSNGTDNYGFSALPGGYRYYNDGTFGNVGYIGLWWSSTECDATYAWYRIMGYDDGSVSRYNNDKRYGFAVRCVRD